jgi:F-type H+-transporting ATPase subunit epsilon
MSATLHLTITTPGAVLVETSDVHALRAEDESGGFGILPGHVDLLTVLRPSVVRWRGEDGVAKYCALRGGVMTVSQGRNVAIACRQGTVGADLATLEAGVRAMQSAETDDERRARVEHMRLHARAVRQLMRLLGSGGLGGELPIKGFAP